MYFTHQRYTSKPFMYWLQQKSAYHNIPLSCLF